MKIRHKLKTTFIIGVIGWFCFPNISYAQRAEVEIAVQQVDNRIRVRLFQHHSSTLFGAFSQDYRVTVENLTQDKLLVQLEYSANLSCGTRKSTLIGPFNEGITINPRETVGRKWGTDGNNTAVRLGDDACPRSSLVKLGKDDTGSDLYTAISSLNYRLINIENISEKERKEAEEKKKKEEEAKKAKEAEDQKLAEQREALAAQASEQQSDERKESAAAAKDDFWSDTQPRSSRSAGDDNIRPASQFSGGLDDIREGGYFKDDKGNYFKKEGNAARIVSKSEYDGDLAQRTNEHAARQAQIRTENIQTINRGIDAGMDILTTSFYAQQLSRSMKDATSIGSDFENIDQLNEAFSQKMQEISYLSEELRSASARNMNTYISAQLVGANSASEQAAISAIGILGSVASSISSDRAERKAQEELTTQRREAEAEIRELQREALVAIRHEIGNAFPEGGMPLSSHKINAPVLYLFAYSNDRTNWDEDQDVPLTVSNVIPVYRYSDGTYPYSSNIKRTFETGGVSNPVIVGYFTDARQAQQYRNSLVNLAPNAKFTLSNVEIKVKQRSPADVQSVSNDTDFWGNKKSDSTPQKTSSDKELDFWGMPVNNKTNSAPQKTNSDKELDFWGMPVNSTSKTAIQKEELQKKEAPKKNDDFWNN